MLFKRPSWRERDVTLRGSQIENYRQLPRWFGVILTMISRSDWFGYPVGIKLKSVLTAQLTRVKRRRHRAQND